jgi:peptidoglycan hydrolase CwlO-like protein
MDWITIISSSVVGFLTFLLGQQKGKKEVESLHLQNLEKSINIYKVIIDDMKEELADLRKEIEQLEKKVQELLEENTKLKTLLTK